LTGGRIYRSKIIEAKLNVIDVSLKKPTARAKYRMPETRALCWPVSVEKMHDIASLLCPCLSSDLYLKWASLEEYIVVSPEKAKFHIFKEKSGQNVTFPFFFNDVFLLILVFSPAAKARGETVHIPHFFTYTWYRLTENWKLFIGHTSPIINKITFLFKIT